MSDRYMVVELSEWNSSKVALSLKFQPLANQHAQNGYRLVSCSIADSAVHDDIFHHLLAVFELIDMSGGVR